MHKNFFSSGFSLIELLVAITIVGILASVSYVGFEKIQAGARDDARISDLATIKTALSFYHMDTDTYPVVGSRILIGENSQHSNEFVAALTPKYIKALPQDPLNPKADESGEEYYYRYKATSDDSYKICAKMEASESKYVCVDGRINSKIFYTNDLNILDN